MYIKKKHSTARRMLKKKNSNTIELNNSKNSINKIVIKNVQFTDSLFAGRSAAFFNDIPTNIVQVVYENIAAFSGQLCLPKLFNGFY